MQHHAEGRSGGCDQQLGLVDTKRVGRKGARYFNELVKGWNFPLHPRSSVCKCAGCKARVDHNTLVIAARTDA